MEEYNQNTILKLNNVYKSYGDIDAVKGVNLSINKGDVYGFLGPNGAGKTTTIRLILRLLYLDQGSIEINGYDINQDFEKAISDVGAVVETPKFYEYLSGYENLKQIVNLHPDIPLTKIEEVIEIVGLEDRINDKVETYSLGMKQRLGIARALVNDPQLMILDEPTNGLDPQGMKETRELINELASKRDITFFISTHLLNEVEQICNKVAILNKGEVVTSGQVSILLDQNKELVEIITEDKKLAQKVLDEREQVVVTEIREDGINIEVNKGQMKEINRILFNEGVEVEYIIPRNQSLEEYFIDITNGSDEDV